ncbi:hypothetical protein NKT34_08555 [Paenibacillus polysaccharolyticus]|uniref:hypothetical protein n=1 Tax=Paenibacillus polysaccharolyticus TaxID=582692 RepID=UPI0020A06BFB|nr:hypothetical protein [Paenibacillus polysaccharolyticus]MCP1133338.1 hypothetical protein [Paenibacillus polysaccharolyticus]
MNWCTKDIQKHTFVELRDNEELSIDRIHSTSTLDEISFISQYYCLKSLSMGKHAFLQIPIHDTECYETVMGQIVPHFSDVRIVKYSNEITEVNLMSIKESTVNMINILIANNNINPVAYDMFGDNYNNSDLPKEMFNLDWYTIDLQKINRLNMDEKLLDFSVFLQKTHLVNGDSFAVQVNDWSFNDTLKDRIAFRFLCTLSQTVQLGVDKNNKVIDVRSF